MSIGSAPRSLRTASSSEGARRVITRDDAGKIASLNRERLQTVQLVLELLVGFDQATIQRGLLLKCFEPAVEAGLCADQMRTSSRIDRSDQADVRYAVAQLRHRMFGREQRARPVGLDPHAATRLLLHPFDPGDVGATERMAGAVRRCVRQHGDTWRRVRTRDQTETEQCEHQSHNRPSRRRKSAT